MPGKDIAPHTAAFAALSRVANGGFGVIVQQFSDLFPV